MACGERTVTIGRNPREHSRPAGNLVWRSRGGDATHWWRLARGL